MISSSTSPSTDCGTADGVVKSNRSRPGALSEPACAAESPSARRSPACSRCVAECDRDTDARRSRSTCASTTSPGRTSPDSTVARCAISPGSGCCTSTTVSSASRPADVDRQPAPVGELAAALGVERRHVEDDLDLVALDAPPARSPCSPSKAVIVASRDHLGVAGELRRAAVERAAVERQVDVRGLLRLRVGLRPRALLLHQPAEAGLVDRRGPARPPSPASGRSGSRRCRAAGTRGRRTAASRRPPSCRAPRRRRSSCPSAASAGTRPPRRTRTARCGRSRSRARGTTAPCSRARPATVRAARGPARRAAASRAPRGAACGAARNRVRRWPGVTPSPMSIRPERTWSATTRMRTSSGCDSFAACPECAP